MIVFDHVSKYYTTGNREKNVGIEDISVHIHPGDFVFLVGPSGAGKSTFIKLILRELEADEGEIFVDGKNVTEMSNREIPALRRSIGIVFQDFRLLPKKTVFENVAFAMEITHSGRRAIRRNVPQVLDLVGIGDKADNYPDQLSAGEKQRVAIARAIINNPKMLIADEPTGNLDPVTAKDIMVLLNQINRRGTTVVMVTHAKDIVDRMNKRVIAIEDGHIVRDDEAGHYGFRKAEDASFAPSVPSETSVAPEEPVRTAGETAAETSRLTGTAAPLSDETPAAGEAVSIGSATVAAIPAAGTPETAVSSAEPAGTAAPSAGTAAPLSDEAPAGEAPDAEAASEAAPENPEDIPFREEDLLEAIRESERRRAARYDALAEKRVGMRTFFGMSEDEASSDTVRIDSANAGDGGKEAQ